MAATLGTIQPDVVHDRAHLGEKVRVFPITGVADTNTLDIGVNGITRVAWQSTAITDFVATSFSGSTITFGTDGVTTYAGNLIVWSKG